MRSTRLDLALSSGALLLPPAGDIVVMRPRIGDELAALPRDRVVVQTGFKPDFDYFVAQGYRTEPSGKPGMALICLPRAKAEARAMLAAAADAGLIVVDGQKTDGVDTVLKDLRALRLQVSEPVSKAHGKLAVVLPGPELAEWAAAPRAVAERFVTLPSVFSADGPDRGSMLLAGALPVKLPPRVADLGAGWGYLSRAILARAGVQEVELVEAEADALTCARMNITDDRARFVWADAVTYKPRKPWDAVVMNPPFHAGREAEASLGMGFIQAAHRGLMPSGSLWMVANRHLPYDKLLTTLFRKVESLGGDASFRLTKASYPIRG